MKRSIDVILSVVALVLLSPLMLIISVLVLVSIGRPVFFRQTRPGLNCQPFDLIKFRSMTELVKTDGSHQADQERLSRFGKFLRATSLDELPELWNVLIGDMSFVGPRPLLMEYLALYTVEQNRRHEVRPGITGWAQVNGRNAISWSKKFALDVWYVDNQSFLLDVRILFMTLKSVVLREGITHPGEATTNRFTGDD